MGIMNPEDTVMDSKWFEYDWRFESEYAVLGVEMGYAADDDMRSKYAELVTVTADSKRDMMTDSEWRKFESIKNKLIRKFGVQYTGFVKLSRRAIYIFYAQNRSTASAMEVYLSKYRFISCDTKTDVDWNNYFKLLYPTDTKLQTDENAKTIDLYRRMGDVLTAPRKVTLHMYFPSESLRILFEEQARLSGFAIGESEFSMEYDKPHGVQIHKISPLYKRDLDEITTRAMNIARRYDGQLTYWEAEKIKKR